MDELLKAIMEELERAFATTEYKSVKIELCQTAKTCKIVGRDGEAIKRPMTNRQWLESLSDEGFAQEMSKASIPCTDKSFDCPRDEDVEIDCKSLFQCQLAWLKQEHKE